ncbi:MAG TPA: 30S ribosomal protein S6 [Caldisericia bacterium]|nr:30S ribosomal protein S6 [Caldisericia bacterium]HPB33749.1 30S ribosomal protein S6 [Caldisericia bacterium]HQL66179.1 30S ribosomal protein S6 [Caldisericia bacterium]HQN49020.1 30S ribosomal protein S6 [Caldisericia bacterium]HQP00443.1 30S ribosomal protein S6 [Caldisericia bacterium]
MRKYEMMVIFKPNLSDEDLKNEEEKIKNLILELGGEFINSNLWGKRKLAYQIEKQSEGIYYLFYFRIPQNKLTEFKTTLKLNMNILRFMILKMEDTVNV